jgi:hypothetical protein
MQTLFKVCKSQIVRLIPQSQIRKFLGYVSSQIANQQIFMIKTLIAKQQREGDLITWRLAIFYFLSEMEQT